MEAKDTVMDIEVMKAEIWDLGIGLEGAERREPTQKERFERIAQAQAEISFKAGIREVVEWVQKNMWKQGSIEKWQAKLKEWGINEEDAD